MKTPTTTKHMIRIYDAGLTTIARLRIATVMLRLTHSKRQSPFTINDIHLRISTLGPVSRTKITNTLSEFRKLDPPLVKVVGTESGTTRSHLLFELTPHGKRLGGLLGW